MTHQPVQRSCVALDLMRGLAAMAVMLGHIRGQSWVDFGSLPPAQHTPVVAVFFALTRLGFEAVLVFFVLSGALVGGQILARVRQRRFVLADYAIDRTTRILLPLIPACLLTFAINWLFFNAPNPPGDVLANMFGLGNLLAPVLEGNAPLWSLPYEIWFYILGGALAHIVMTRSSIPAFAVAAVAVGVFTVLSPIFLMFWVLGAVTTLILEQPHKNTTFALGFALAAAGIVFSQLAFVSKAFTHPAYVSRTTAEVMICGGICLMLPLMYSERANAALHFIARPAAFVSGMSYTLYLVHYPVLSALDLVLPQANEISVGSMVYFLARIAVCTAVSLVFYVLFERRTPALRRWLRASLAGAGLGVKAAR